MSSPASQHHIPRLVRSYERGIITLDSLIGEVNSLILSGAVLYIDALDELCDPTDPDTTLADAARAGLINPSTTPPTPTDPVSPSHIPTPHPSTDPSAPFSPSDAGLSILSPASLASRESLIDRESAPPLPSPADLARYSEIERLRAELASLKAAHAASLASQALSASEIEARSLHARCTPTIIGHQDNTESPTSLFDMALGHSPAQLLANLQASLHLPSFTSTDPFPDGPIALVPVRLYPLATPDPKRPYLLDPRTSSPRLNRDGQPIPNLILGSTQIRTSFASHKTRFLAQLPDGRLIPSPLPVDYSLQALCIINAHPFFTPSDAHSKLLDAQSTAEHALRAHTPVSSPLPAHEDSAALLPPLPPPPPRAPRRLSNPA